MKKEVCTLYLVKLTVQRGDQIVRQVTFKQGLNLITDAPTTQANTSGNSVGKTTVLRLIDFCLGSDGNDIWQDSEFKDNINQDVYDFLHGVVPVYVTLLCETPLGRSHQFSRAFDLKNRDLLSFSIDQKRVRNLKEYRNQAKEIFFGAGGKKPSMRQLAPKFVRSSPQLMSKTLKYLGDYGSESDYESLYLFLFGFLDIHLLEERAQLKTDRKNLERDLQALNRLRKEGELEQLLYHLTREIEALSGSPELKGSIPEIEVSASKVTATRAEAANTAAALSRIDSEISSLQAAINQLADAATSFDRAAIEAVYRDAQRYLPKLQHDFEDMASFVVSLRGRKQRFLEKQIGDLRAQSERFISQLNRLQAQENQQIGDLIASPEFTHALEVRSELQDKLRRLGSLEQSLKDIRDLKARLSFIDEQLLKTKQQIEDARSLLSERVRSFNEAFSRLSKLLYGEQYILHFEETDKGTFTFQLSAIGSNVGAGKKVSQTAAFDFAYIDFLESANLPFPRFVCHDGIETVHANQMAALLKSAEGVNGQLVLAVLRDKLPPLGSDFIRTNTILELSQDNKFFGLEDTSYIRERG